MNVLSAITAYPPSVGGAQFHAHELHRALVRRDATVEVATLWRSTRQDWLRGTTIAAPSPRPPDNLDGIRIFRLGLTFPRRFMALPLAMAYYPAMRATAPALSRLFLEQATDLVRGHDPNVGHLSRIGREWFYEAFVRAFETADVPWVLTPNHHPHWTRRRDWWWWDIYRRAGAVLVLSDFEGEQLVRGGVDPRRIVRTVVGPVGEPPPVPPADSPERPNVVFLGQVKLYKGLDLLHDAMTIVRRTIPGTTLTVIGPWMDAQRRLRRRLLSERGARVLGVVDDKRKWDELRAATVVCVPSQEEALGGAYLEGWTMGRPAIGLDIPTVAELFDRTAGGEVVRCDPDELATALIEMIEDPARADALGRAGRKAVETEYNWQVAAERALTAYRVAGAGM